MDSKTSILNAIKNALADVDRSATPMPELPEIWPIQNASPSELAASFAENLAAVAGEAVLCADENAALEAVGRVLAELNANPPANVPSGSPLELGVFSNPELATFAEKLVAANSNWKTVYAPETPADADPKERQTLAAGLVSPLLLLADTGTAAVEARAAFDRFLCYLVPVCLVVARRTQLREHLPAAFPEIEAKMRDPNQRGEIALITGPSRTADIEKILVLGVHGPRRLIVFIIED